MRNISIEADREKEAFLSTEKSKVYRNTVVRIVSVYKANPTRWFSLLKSSKEIFSDLAGGGTTATDFNKVFLPVNSKNPTTFQCGWIFYLVLEINKFDSLENSAWKVKLY